MKKLYGRIGRWSDVKTRINEAAAIGATIKRDKDAGTVEVTHGDSTLFRALNKGNGVWLVLYNEEFYPRIPTPAISGNLVEVL